MQNEEDVIVESSPEEVIEETQQEETPEVEPESIKTVPYDRFKRVNDELSKLKKEPPKVVNKSLDVDDYINISASLEGLDSKEKEYLAEQHKYTGKPLNDLRNDENFLLWQGAYRAKVEKERSSLKPNSAQSETDRPKSLTEKLRGASLEDREKILSDAGLYKSPRPRADRVSISGIR